MKNILIFAGIAGIAAAIAIYFTSESAKNGGEYIADSAVDTYDDMAENVQGRSGIVREGFHAMS